MRAETCVSGNFTRFRLCSTLIIDIMRQSVYNSYIRNKEDIYMIDFSDKTQLTSFVAVVAVILCLLAMVIVFWTRMKKRLSGGAFAAWLTVTIIILAAGIAACLISIAYKTEFLKIDSEVVGNALAFEYDGNIVFSIPGLGVFFDVVFNYALVEMLLYAVTLVDLALLVLVCIRRGVTRTLYSGNCDGEGYYTVSEHEDEPGAFAVCDEPNGTGDEHTEGETEPVAAVSEEPTAADETQAVEQETEETIEKDTAGEETTEPAAEVNIVATEENDEEETVSQANDMPAPLEEYVEDEEPVAEENEQPVAEEAVWVEEENQPTEFVEEAVPEEKEGIKEEIEEPVETTESAPIADEEPTTEDKIAKAESEPTTEEEPAIGTEKTRSEEPATEIGTPVESANVTEPEKAGTETPESAKPAQPEEKAPDRAARFMAPVVAADKARRTSETATAARKNGRVVVKSRAAEMFGEYLGGRSAEDREKLLDSIDVITKKND